MENLQLQQGVYLAPTPAGAFYCSASPQEDPARHLLQSLISQRQSPVLDNASLEAWCGTSTEDATTLLYHMQRQSLVQGLSKPQICPEGPLEEVIPFLLPALSGDNKALLADDQGFYVASSGFPHESAEELAALSASLGLLHKRHQRLLNKNLGYQGNAWTLGDAAGNSQIGFWPLFVGTQRFSLVISGLPRFNQNAFSRLVWSLGIRYGDQPRNPSTQTD
ncbi:roadblock/LC7 domain-containing protein [Thiolapillus brandeum]|uniref:Roadblock/LC7 domain-containing protein n=1 Tax=Thiolapillus brandeum TaxID=1076588 RepID=A0A7U6JIN3_9GAMM|nr:roadblock/LC7 domain-containing protein [Thiolapillus brandeum]BAO45714.1 conserved hypothetical protein [Thiolapillus brandeum]